MCIRDSVKNLFLYYLQNRKAKTLEQVIDLFVSDRIKKTLSPACLRHVLSTEGKGWFGPEKLTEVIDTYEVRYTCRVSTVSFRTQAQRSLEISL